MTQLLLAFRLVTFYGSDIMLAISLKNYYNTTLNYSNHYLQHASQLKNGAFKHSVTT